MTNRSFVLLLGGCLSASALFADFSYEQTTKFTGGAMMGMMKIAGAFSREAREPMTSKVMVKGDRMAHVSARRIEVIDVAAETITSIDLEKQTYSVMTFAEMKAALEEMSAKMKEKSKDGQEMKFSVSAKNTGQSRTIAGFPAKEIQMTIRVEGQDAKSGQKGALNLLNDIWMAPGVAGYEEVKAFHQKMAAKLAWSPGSNFAMAMQPGAGQGMAEMSKEMAKLDGVPVLTIMRMGPEGMAMPQPGDPNQQGQQNAPEGPTAGQAAGSAAGSTVAGKLPGLGRLGGFGGFGRKKKQEPEQQQQPPAQQQQQQEQQAANASLMEITTETTAFSSAPVDASKLEVPAGFKKVEAEMNKRRR